MAQAQVIAKVAALSGEAFARDAAGKMRRLKLGDVIREGETVLSADGGQVILQLADGRQMPVRPGDVARIDVEVGAPVKPNATDSAVANDKKGFQKIAKALNSGGNLDQLLEEEAPAAGTASGGDEGHTFVEFLRVVETVDPQAYQFGFAATGTPQLQGNPAILSDFAPPTVSAFLDSASDSGLKGDGLTNDKTPTISGAGEPGAKIAVTMPTGEILTTIVAPDGKWTVTPTVDLPDGKADITVKATDDAGNTTTVTVPITVDTTPPALKAVLDPASDSGTKGDGITSDKTPTISGTGEPGAQIEVTVPSTGEKLTTTVGSDGTWSVTPKSDLPEGKTDISVKETDPAGNSSTVTVPVTIDTTVPNAGAAPKVDITEDANNDGFINKAELVGQVDVKVTFDPTKVSLGDVVKVTSGGVTKDVAVTAGDLSNGYVTTSFAPAAEGVTQVVTAVIVDAAGNQSGTGADSAKLDLSSLDGIAIKITEDADNDGFINKAELQGTVGVEVTLPATAVAGDLLTLKASGNADQSIVLTQAQIDAGKVVIELPAPASGATLVVTAQVTDPAGNKSAEVSDSAKLDTVAPDLTAQLDPTSDSGTKGDGITSDKTPTISGTGEPGAKIEVTVPSTGEKLTTTVQPDGTWSVTPVTDLPEGKTDISVKETDPAGNTTTATVPVTVDTKAPDLTAQLDPTSDSGTKGDGLTNDATPTISGTGEPGAKIEVTMPGTGEKLTTTVQPDGTWSVTPTQALPDGGPVNVAVKETDASGNTTEKTVPVTIDASVPNGGNAPVVEITEDANNDGFINKAEAVGNAGVKVSFDGTKVSVGDVVEITSGGVTNKVTITAADQSNGYVTTEFAPQASGTVMDVTAQIVDAAGNKSGTGTDSAKLDLTVFGTPVVKITEDANDDGFINKAELQGTVGVEVGLPAGAVAGDLLTVKSTGNADQGIVLTQAQIDAGKVVLELVAPGNGTELVVTAQVKDAAGNESPVASDKAVIATADQGAPVVSITEDTNNDGWLNAGELSGDVGVNVGLPGTAKAGDSLLVSVNGVDRAPIVLTAADIAAGNVAITGVVSPGEGQTLTVTAQIKDVAQNLGPVGSDSAKVDTTAYQNLAISITEDTNNDGFINASELNGKVDVRVTVPQGAAVGDTLTVTGSGNVAQVITLTAQQIATGYVDVAFNPTASGTTFEATASIKDAAGNSAGPVKDTAQLVLSQPGAPVVTIAEDADNNGFISNAELNGDVGVTIALPATAKAGDSLLVTVNGVALTPIVLTAADILANNVSVPGVQSPGEGQTLTVSAQVKDVAGNVGPLGSDSAKVDTVAPNLTAQLDPNSDSGTKGDGLTNDATPTISGTGEPGAKIEVTMPSTGEKLTTTVQPDGTWSVTPVQALPNGGPVDVLVKETDPAGNTTEKTVPVTIDASVPNNGTAPVVEITEDANNDQWINRSELQGNVDVKVSFNGALVSVGDVVEVTSGGVTNKVSITAADKTNGYVTTNFAAPADGTTMTVSAVIVDAAGNGTQPGTDSAKLDLTQYQNLAISITEDTDNNGFINASELSGNVDVRVAVPQGAAVGDTLTVTASGNVAQVITLTAAHIAAGHVDVTFNPTADGTDFVATATIKDAAGNTLGPVTDTAKIQLAQPGTPLVTIQEDKDNDGWINKGELSGDIDVSVTLPGTAKAGDSLLVTVNGVLLAPIVLTQADIDKNSVAVAGVGNPGEGKALEVTAQVKDVAGNLGPVGKDTATVDTTPPNGGAAPTVEITEDANNNGWISQAELNGAVDVKVSFDASQVAVGDKVLVTSGGVTNTVTVSLTDKANGYVTTSFTAPADGSTMTVTAKVVDAAGNASQEGSDSAKLDLSVPNGGDAPKVDITEDANNDGFINKAELVGQVDVKVTFDPTKVSLGDVVKVTSGGVTKDVAVTAGDLSNGYVTTSFAPAAEGVTQVVTAVIVDAAGNQSGTGADSAKLDLSSLDGIAIKITEDADNDGFINKAELQGTVGVEVTLPATAVAGDLLTLKASGNADQSIVLTQAQIDAGKVVIELPAPASGATLVVTAQVTDPAGNKSAEVSDSAKLDTVAPDLTAQLDPTSDSGTKGDGITSDKTPTISGTGEPGAKIEVTVPSTGEKLTTTVQPDGTWSVTPVTDLPEGKTDISVKETDPAGNTTTATVPVTVDTKAPDLTAQLDPTSDSGTKGDGLTNDATPTISGTGEPGAKIEVTMPGTGEKLTTTVQPDGTWSVTPTQALPDGGPVNVAVKETDASGNTTEKTVPVTIDASVPNGGNAPVVEITEDANNDGFINKAEAVGNAGVKVSFDGTKVSVGDVVEITSGGVTNKVTITAADQSNGYVTTEFAPQASGTVMDVTAQIVDAAGNKSGTGTDSAKLDLTVFGTPVVKITEDANDDGFINKAELQGTVGVEVGLPAGAVAGDLLTVKSTGNADQGIVLTQAQIDAGKVVLELVAPGNGTELVVTAQVKDAAGNESPVASDKAVIATADQGAPVVSITEDTNNDGWLNAGELSGDVGVNVGLPGTAKAGDSLLVSVNGVDRAPIVLTAADIAAGNVAITGVVSPGEGQTLTVTAQIKDVAQNLGPVGSDSAKVDTTAYQNLAISITEDTNNDGFINASELNGKVDVRVTVPQGAAVGDTLTVTGSGNVAQVITLTAQQIATGYVDVAFNPTASGTTFEATASIKDAAGNSAGPVKDTAQLVLSQPGAPVVTIAEDADNNGFISNAELNGDVGVTIALPATAKAGDSLLVTVNGVALTPIVLTAADILANNVSVPGVQSPGEGQTLTVSAQVKDVAGNVGPLGSDSAKVDTVAPNLTAQLDPNSDSGTKGDGLTNDATPTISGTGEPGAKIEVTMPSTGEKLTTTVQPDGTWSVTPVQALPNGGPVDVLVKETDPAGNTTEKTVPVTIDASVPNNGTAPVVEITEDANNDQWINRSELQGNVDVKVSFNGALVSVGDVVEVTSGGVTNKVSITAADKTNGYVTTNFAAPADGTTMTVSAVIVDAAGNGTQPGTDSAKLDLTQYQNLAISITEDTDNNGFINASELSGNVDVRVAVPQGAAVGDTLTVTASGNVAQVITLTAAHIAAGHVDVTFNPTADGTDFVATATIKDAAGNTLGPVTDTAKIQLAQPGTPLVTIQEDKDNDGWINKGELSGDIDVSVTLPGTAKAGDSLLVTVNGVLLAPIVLTQADIDKNSVAVAGVGNPGEGKALEVTAQVKDVAGNLGPVGKDTATVDTTPPGLTAQLDPASDSGMPGDGITNDRTPTITGTGEPGAKIEVTMPGTGEKLTTTVQPNGTWSVTPTQDIPLGAQTVQVKETDQAGNTTTASVPVTIAIDPPNGGLAPTVDIVEDADNNGVINKAELLGNVDVKVSFDGSKVAVGDIVEITSGGVTNRVTVSVADKASGYVMTTFAPPAEGAEIAVKAVIIDKVGNTSPEGTDKATLDTTPTNGGLAPTVEITEDANNDGFINAAELNGEVGVKVSFDGTKVLVGEVVSVTSGGVTKLVTISAADKAAGFVTTSFPAPAEGTEMLVKAVVLDAAGNPTPEGSDKATLDTTPTHGGLAPTVDITEDANNDGFISAAELNGDIGVKVSFDGTKVVVGEVVSVTSGGVTKLVTITDADKAAGFVTTTFTAPPEGTEMVVKAVVLDRAGNATPEASDKATLDTTPSNGGLAPTVEITEDANNDGYINQAEAVGLADVKVSFDGSKVAIGDKIVIISGSETQTITIDAAAKANGYVTAAFTPVAEGQTMTVTASIVDPAGNATPTGSDSAVVDTTPSNGGLAPTVEITEDANNDGFINQAEAVGQADVKVSFDGSKVAIGDTVVIVSGAETKTVTIDAAAKANGYVTTTFTPVGEGQTMTVTAKIVDPAGNATPVATDSAKVDTTLPSLTAVLDPTSDSATKGDGLTNDRTPTISGTGEPGATIEVTMPGTNEKLTTTVAPNGTWSVTPTQDLPNGGPVDVQVKEIDPAGNVTTAVVPVTIDAAAPSLVITTSDGTLSPGEQVTLTFTFNEKVTGFDASDITVAGGTLNPASLTTTDGGKTWTASFTQTGTANPTVNVAGGTYFDQAGNAGTAASLTLNNAPDAIDDRYVLTSLKSQYWGYREGTDGANLTTVAQVETFANSHTATATFDAKTLDFGGAFSNNLGTAGNLATFIGANGSNLQTTAAYGTTSDAIVKMVGKMNLEAGTYNFRVTADDGFVVRIDGVEVARYDANQSSTVREFANFNIGTSGEHTIEVVYWDQGGYASFKAELRPLGGAYQTLTVDSNYGSGPLVTMEDKALTIDPATLLANDKDQNGDPLQIISVQSPTNGTVALVNGKVVFTPAPNYNGDATFTYTVSDGKGGTDTATVTVKVNPVADGPIVTTTVATVSEEGLAGGLADTTGTPTDKTDAKTATGTVAISDPDGEAISSVVLIAPTTALTSGGVAVTWTGSNTQTLTATAGGQTVATITIDNTGKYTVNLLKPVDHPAGNGENVLSLDVGVKATSGAAGTNGNLSTTGTLTVQIEDDAPNALAPITHALSMTNTNLLITLDVSGSMATADGVGGQTRLQSAIASVKTLLDRYDEFGDVRVSLVKFAGDTETAQLGTSWLTVAQAKSYLDTLAAGGGTNYDSALNTTMNAFNTAGKLANAQNVAYFFTDGVPTFGSGDANTLSGTQNGNGGSPDGVDSGIQVNEETTWKNFLNSNQIKSFSIGMGAGITDASYLHPIAYDGQSMVNTDGVRVSSFDQLDTVLASTVQAPIGGNLVNGGLLSGAVGADAGAYIASVLVEGRTYLFSGAAQTNGVFDAATKTWTITTTIGGKFVVDMDGGTYSYKAPDTLNVANATDTMTYSVSDRDGDTVSSTVQVNVDRTNVTIGTTASETLTGTGQPDLILGRDGDDTIAGGLGNDLLYGGDGVDRISGNEGEDKLYGGSGNDILDGGTGNDLLVGGLGDDSLTGGLGVDTFQWSLADAGTIAAPTRDVIADFDVAARAAGGDVLDLRDLLTAPTNATAAALDNFLHFEVSGGNTTIYVSATGAFGDNNAATKTGSSPAVVTNNDIQQIVLQGVDLVGGNTTDQQVIQDLLTKGKLITD